MDMGRVHRGIRSLARHSLYQALVEDAVKNDKYVLDLRNENTHLYEEITRLRAQLDCEGTGDSQSCCLRCVKTRLAEAQRKIVRLKEVYGPQAQELEQANADLKRINTLQRAALEVWKKAHPYGTNPTPSELEARCARLGESLKDMVNQFAYENSKQQIHTGGLSALEGAFHTLGLADPCERAALAEGQGESK